MPRKKVKSTLYRLLDYKDINREILKDVLSCVRVIKRGGKGTNDPYNNCIIAADTETSKTCDDTYDKKGNYKPQENIVVAWTISVRSDEQNVCTIYGNKPSEFAKCLGMMQEVMQGEKTMVYFHNLAYDWVFLQRFLIADFGTPIHQLNTKPHYPISIEFDNGIIIRDSLIIAQKSLDRWANELEVEHRKACGKWDYDKRRSQNCVFSADEIEYIENDTLALVECLDKLRLQLHKRVYSIPMTCTGIIREVVRKKGREYRAKNRFTRIAPSFEFYTQMLLPCYHGGYTHNNRHAMGQIWGDQETPVECFDFASSYPFRMLVDKYPCERFAEADEPMPYTDILKYSDTTAFIFKFIATGITLKDPFNPMPVLQYSKCIKTLDAETDNGRILCADYVEIIITEVDLELICKQYRFEKHACIDVHYAEKKPLPRWYRDIVWDCFKQKTLLKGGDPVEYALSKAKVNSLYGMLVQKSLRDEISEDYQTGDFTTKCQQTEEAYQTYLENFNSILPYYWGIYVTAYSLKALFELGSCIRSDGFWLYSDTDSVYGWGFDRDKIAEFNKVQIDRLKAAGYEGIEHNNRLYYPGIAELDGQYQEFIGLHSKCYAVRKMDGNVKITVAGVPKIGAKCLGDDLANFKDGFVFPGKDTGKLTHYYVYRDDIYIAPDGTECGNSIDLHECDYVIGLPDISDIFDLVATEDIEVQVYGED